MKYKTLNINGKKIKVLVFEHDIRANVSISEMYEDAEKVLDEADEYERTRIIKTRKARI